MSAVPVLQGFAVGAGLIIAIGAQNAFVIRQGLLRKHVFTVAAVSALCDVTLIAVGVAGVGSAIAASRTVTAVATWGGALFLGYYGLRAFRSAGRAKSLDDVQGTGQSSSARAAAVSALALSLLNPHVYLDTVVLVGSVGAHQAGFARVLFALGAMAASTLWFFGIAYGAALLAPVFRRPAAWRVLDVLVGCMMWTVAAGLLISYLRT
ncbi:L-lysine exporter family protein LysE/ArgO [Kitasatospora sp. MAP12-15]|uniref:LysE/ArgO family amino acid transporter n=1 Tax=unclassified Kitasatospora TaxID=2633591 RepID=UPI00247440FD|nr:LysE/ArgO family amino acid transporter [Kitasatospora sp. MAP12-44]MDH6109381.1 L-lysine exporter family protein LysE/ArgO [Kitasatospora sp. MAP12-44]